MKTKIGQSGFTIIEMLVASAVTGMMLIMVMTFLVNTLVNNSLTEARSDLLRQAQLSLDLIGRDIRLSANVDDTNRWPDTNSPNAVATGGYGWISDNNTLVLAIAAEDNARNVLFEDSLNYITHKNNVVYFLENATLYKRTLVGDNPDNSSTTSCPAATATALCPADRELIKGVTNFTVQYIDGNDVEVDPSLARSVVASLSLQVTRYGRPVTADYEIRMVFRNE
ncbi:MAG: prepilin-type N-terminal cleavage/methylation domain-containing protein [bacterium]|nr:prepilin-type N-terminal cleavage/methylation domain-containing protein [bacterium]